MAMTREQMVDLMTAVVRATRQADAARDAENDAIARLATANKRHDDAKAALTAALNALMDAVKVNASEPEPVATASTTVTVTTP